MPDSHPDKAGWSLKENASGDLHWFKGMEMV